MLIYSSVSRYDCIWSAWGQCSATCGAGKQERNIKSHEQNGGNICRGGRTKNCNHEKPCPGNLPGHFKIKVTKISWWASESHFSPAYFNSVVFMSNFLANYNFFVL